MSEGLYSVRLFLTWLQQPETLCSVVVPFLLIAVLLIGFKAARAKFFCLAGLGLVFAPLSLLLSFWSGKGFHVTPASLLIYLGLVWAKKLDMRRDWGATAAAIWVSTIVPDLLAPSIGGQLTWYWGVGADGLKDGLVTYPILFTGLTALWQGRWLHPRRWLNPRWHPDREP